MNNYFKKILLISLLLLFFISFSFGQDITISNNETNLTNDVKQIKQIKIINNKWVEINAIIANINSNNLKLKTLTNEKNLSKAKKLTDLANDKSVIAAINGDFFDSKTKTAIGPLMKNSEIIYNGSTDKRFSKFALTKSNKPYIFNWDFIDLKANSKDISFGIDYKNKDYTENNNIILLDNSYNEYSIGSYKDNITEVIIKNNKIFDILKNKPKVKIPENGYILSIPNHKNIINNLTVGDKIEINTNKLSNMFESAIGGGSILLKNGIINNDLKLRINGNHPRSAIGYSKNKDKIILATVNGRKSFFPGVTQNEMAKIMLDLKANYAMSLDGGGSSTLIKRKFGQNQFDILNNLSDGYQRKIYNAIAITNENSSFRLDKLKVNINDKLIFKNPTNFKLLGINKDYYPIEINKDKLQILSDLEHKIIDNKFIPLEAGKGTIKFKYEGLELTKNITVYKEFERLEVFPNEIRLSKNQNKNIQFYLYTKDKTKLPINSNDLVYLNKNYFDINNNLFKLKEQIENDQILFFYNGLNTKLKINKPLKNMILDNFQDINGTLDVYPSNVSGKLEQFNNNSLKLNYDFTNYNNKTQAVYYEFKNPVKINKNVKNINLKIDGTYGKNHWLRMEIKDLHGNKKNITLARNINWKGLKNIKYQLNENSNKPFYINKIYIVETNPKKFDKGYVLLDELSVDKIENSNVNVNSYDILKQKIQGNNNNIIHFKNKKDNIKVYLDNNINFQIDDTFDYFEKQNHSFMNLNNKNNTFLNNNGLQWKFIIEKLKNNQNNNIFIFLNNELGFKNKTEEKIFLNILKNLENHPNIFFIINNNKFNLDYYNSHPVIELNKNINYDFKLKTNKNNPSFEISLYN